MRVLLFWVFHLSVLVLLYFVYSVVLRIKPRASHMLDKCSTTKSYPQALGKFSVFMKSCIFFFCFPYFQNLIQEIIAKYNFVQLFLCIVSKSFKKLYVLFWSFDLFWVNFLYIKLGQVQLQSFDVFSKFFQNHLLIKTFISLNDLGIFVKMRLSKHEDFFLSYLFISFIFSSVFISVLKCLDCYCFVVSFKSGTWFVPNCLFFLKIVLTVFKDCFSVPCNSPWISDGISYPEKITLGFL
jgi:hypothetical protein